MSTEQLILAMASITDVISLLPTRRCEVSERPGSVEEQDRFAELISSCWTDLGPSNRYFKALVRSYVAELEKAGATMESDKLMDLVIRISLDKEKAPTPEESCYLSFQLQPFDDDDTDDRPLLKIQVYPYHNDVALRLWEAGATLAEYFLQYPTLVQGKRVIELGAGVGLTGLAIAGCCGVQDVFLTDFTEVCRVNMAHNIAINEKWLNKKSRVISHGYLEWSSFAAGAQSDSNNLLATAEIDKQSLDAFNDADVLLAADVCYDVGVLKDLVTIVLRFLQRSPKTKQAIFGMTRRNMHTFNTFLGLLAEEGIAYDWIWEWDSRPNLPILFPCNFIQERSDVRIASLTMDQ